MKPMRMTSAILLVAFLCAASSWAQQGWEPATKGALLRADWGKVAEAAQQSKQSDADAAVADWLLGYAGLATGDYQQALEGFSHLDTTTKAQAVLNYASALADQNRGNAIAQMLKGDALARSGKYEEALATLDEAAHLDSRSALICDVRGVVRTLAGKAEDALADFEQAIELDPKLADAHANSGLVLLAAGSPSGAVESLTLALELAPEFALAYNGRGVAYALMETWEEAENDFKKVAALAPGLSFARGNGQFVIRTRSQIAFRQSLQDDAGDGRGSTLIAQSFEHRLEDVGGGRTMDVFIIKATPQTSTFGGMKEVVQGITRQLRVQNGLPDTWQPRLQLDGSAFNSTPYDRTKFAAAMAQQAGRDAVVVMDFSPWFKGANRLATAERMLTWSPNVTEAAERLAWASASINLTTGNKPNLDAYSAVAEAAIRMGEKLTGYAPEVRNNVGFGKILIHGYPWQQLPGKDVAVPEALLTSAEGIFNIYSPGFMNNKLAPSEKVFNITVFDSTGKGIRHANLDDLTLSGGRPNPVLQIGGAALRGLEPGALQQITGQINQGKVPPAALFDDTKKIPAVPLPSIRALTQNLDRLSQSVTLLYKLAGEEPPMDLKLALNFTRPVIQDLHAASAGQFNPWASQTLEQTGKFALKELPRVVDKLVKEGKLPNSYGAAFNKLSPVLAGLPDTLTAGAAQMGRGQLIPTADEMIGYLNGANKLAWATLGFIQAGPKGASLYSTAGGLVANIVQGATESIVTRQMLTPDRERLVQVWRKQVDWAAERGLPAKTFSETFDLQLIKELRFNQKTVAEFDNLARWSNAATAANHTSGASSESLQNLLRPIPLGAGPLQDDSWKRYSILPPNSPPPGPPPNYRLPSTALTSSPGDKRGGVKMKADVVKGQPADTSEMFGGGASEKPAVATQQEALLSPFLLFCAMAAGR